jgi:hypothetical protein
MAQQENTNDMPVMVGALVVGLIACGIFFFMKKDPVAAPTATQPVKTPVNAQAVQPTMIETKGTLPDAAAGGGGAPGGGGAAAGPAAGGRGGPTIGGMTPGG